MPTVAEMEATAQRMLEKYHLPRFAFAVDGVFTKFQEAPRNLPPGKHKQQFWTRKGGYGLNNQVVAGDTLLIYDIDCRWPGQTHDARIWKRSAVRLFVEEQRRFLIAGKKLRTRRDHSNVVKPGIRKKNMSRCGKYSRCGGV